MVNDVHTCPPVATATLPNSMRPLFWLSSVRTDTLTLQKHHMSSVRTDTFTLQKHHMSTVRTDALTLKKICMSIARIDTLTSQDKNVHGP